MTSPFKGSMQNEPKPELGISHCNRKWKHPCKVFCVRHCAVKTKTTANITKTTDNDRGGKENKEISKKETRS